MNGPRSAGRSPAAALLLVSLIALLVVACGGPPAATSTATEESTARPTAAATEEATATEEPTEEPTEEATATEEPSEGPAGIAGIGTQVQVGDEQYVTVTGSLPWEGNDTQQPAAGNVFLAVNIRIDAITETSYTSGDFTLEDVDCNTYVEAAPGLAPHLFSEDNMAPNTYTTGNVTFEVPDALADNLALIYSPDFLDATFKFQLRGSGRCQD